MKKKQLLTISDLGDECLAALFQSTAALKKSPSAYHRALTGKSLGLIFEKPSTRTRVSFEVGMNQLGGSSFYLSPEEIQPGKRETVKDIARTLSRYLDCIVLRTFEHSLIEEFNSYATIPVINGLSNNAHPCQALADYFTILEKFPSPQGIKIAYLGDSNNVFNSLLLILSRYAITVHVATPAAYSPSESVRQAAETYARTSGARITYTHCAEEAVEGAHIIYTDVWVSMGEETKGKSRKLFAPFQVNEALVAKADNNALIMHCLPAHRGEEITDEVIDSPHSIVFDQAENRLHVQKAILLHFLSGKE